MNDIVKLLESINAKDFKIVGKKVIIKSLDLRNTLPGVFSDVKYELYLDMLEANYVPKCIKLCNTLVLDANEYFDGYIPKVKEYLSMFSDIGSVDLTLNKVHCEKVYLNDFKYHGSITSNNITLGQSNLSAFMKDLKLNGVGEDSNLLAKAKVYKNISIDNFHNVKLCGNNSVFNGNLTIENCFNVDLSYVPYIHKCQDVNIKNITNLYVLYPFVSDCVIESDKVSFMNSNFLNNKISLSKFKGVYLCNECVFEGKFYNKHTKKLPFPNVEFK